MDNDTWHILFDEPQIIAVAISVAIGVVALLMIPCFRYFRSRRVRIWATFLAGLFALLAVVYGDLAFTRWALYDGGHGHPLRVAPINQWLNFAAINALLALVAGMVGGGLGILIGKVTRRAVV
jgi:hypothetical protein